MLAGGLTRPGVTQEISLGVSAWPQIRAVEPTQTREKIFLNR